MKKIFLVFSLIFVGIFALAQENTKMQRLMNLVENMQIVASEDFPVPFDWSYLPQDQEAFDVFTVASEKYKQNPQNFAAVYNYAMVLAHQNQGNGSVASFQAYELFEEAKSLNKDFWPLYQEQEKLMVNYYFYGTIDAPLNFIEKVDRYEGLFEFALKRLDLIENQVRLRAKNINYLDGALICRLKKDADGESFFLKKAGGIKALKEEVRKAALEIQKGLFAEEAPSWHMQANAVLALDKNLKKIDEFYGEYLSDVEEYQALEQQVQKEKEKINKWFGGKVSGFR